MVEGAPLQGHEVKLANCNSVAGVWVVAPGDCAHPVEEGQVCTVGIGQWEYLSAGAWDQTMSYMPPLLEER